MFCTELQKKWIYINIAGYWKYIKVLVPDGVAAGGSKIYPFGAGADVEIMCCVKIMFLYKMY